MYWWVWVNDTQRTRPYESFIWAGLGNGGFRSMRFSEPAPTNIENRGLSLRAPLGARQSLSMWCVQLSNAPYESSARCMPSL